jgi:Fur family ferric uptake transcriptional regulator
MGKSRKQLSEGVALSALKDLRLKATGPRRAVVEVMALEHHPVSARDIFDRLKPGSCDLATVYRSLAALERTGLAHRYDLGDGVARYELLHGTRKHHHHHLVCTRCSEVVEIEHCAIQEMERMVAERNGFESVSHRLEFFGVCPSCQ